MASSKLAALRTGRAAEVIQPASRAFMLGYLLDALPTIFKHVLRYVLVNLRTISRVRKRIAQEKADQTTFSPASGFNEEHVKTDLRIDIPAAQRTSLYSDGVKPALQQLPTLLHSILRTLLVSFGPKGVAFTCALAMSSTTIMDMILSRLLMPQGTVSNVLKDRRKALSTFVSAALSSYFALYMIQRDAIGDHDALKGQYGFSNPFKRKNNQLVMPTPLAPGGHFLARLTSLSVPATPGERGSRSPEERSSSRQPSLSPVDEKYSNVSTFPPATSGSPSSALGFTSPTIDLSLFALVRAMDTFVRIAPLLFASRSVNLKGTPVGPAAGMKIDTTRNELARATQHARMGLHTRLARSVVDFGRNQAEGLTFVVACAVIMYNWFYHPERLPPTYVKWISNLASMDHRLLDALRCIRMNKPYRYNYGDKSTEPGGINLLGSLAESMGHPYGWGDISRLPHTRQQARQQKRESASAGDQSDYILEGAAGPRGRGEMGGVPCELIHCGVGGPSCVKNALYRFLRAYKVCLGIYIPVHLLPRLIFGPGQFKRAPVDSITKVLKGSMRSAAFLSTYIASIWFMVCLARSMLLPRLFPNVSFRYWDSGLGPILGSWTCGWSVFIEEKRKRAEMALYVAPRALFALAEMAKPGWLSKGQKSALQAERLLFGMSVGIVVAAAKHRPDLLRGLTALIAWVAAAPQRQGVSPVRAPRH